MQDKRTLFGILVKSLKPDNRKDCLSTTLFNQMTSLLKLETPRVWNWANILTSWWSVKLTVIVEDGDLHDAGPTQLHLPISVTLQHRQLEEELLVRLPLVVVHNRHPDLQVINVNMLNRIPPLLPLSQFHTAQMWGFRWLQCSLPPRWQTRQ